MNNDEAIINRLEVLSRLSLTEAEKVCVARDVKKIISYFDSLRELDTDGVELSPDSEQHKNVLREDDVSESSAADEILNAAPEKENGFFAVPRTVK